MTFRDPLIVRWLVVAATLWAAFSRFHRILTLPPQAWVDEIWIALRARELLQTGTIHVFYKTFWGGAHPLIVYFTALAQAAGFDSLIASRAIAAAGGVLTIPLAFACFDELWRGQWPAPRRRLTAALTAIILSNLLYTVVVSRVGYEPALVPVPMLFCVWQMRRAQRTGQWTGWVLAGLALGLAQYLVHHSRFLIPLIGLLWLHDLVRRRRVLHVSGMGLLAAVAILVALPLIIFFVQEPEWLFARARAVTAIPRQTGPPFLLENLRLVLASFSFQGDASLRHNLAGRPMFDWIQSIGFWAGIVWAVVHFRRAAQARDLLIWIVVMMVPSLITDEAPQFERLIGLAAPAAALVAIGWVEIWLWVSQRLDRVKVGGHGKNPVEAANWAAALLVVTSLGRNAHDYFVRYPAAPGLDATFTTTPVALASQLIERARTEPVFVERITEADDVFAFDYLFPGTPVRRLDFRQCLPVPHRRQTRTTYLVISERDPATVATLARAYPAATITPIQPEEAALMGEATLVEVPPGAAAPALPQRAHARFEPGLSLYGFEWSGKTVKAGESLLLTLYWVAENEFEADVTRFLHVGTGDEGLPLIAQHDGQPCQGLYPTSSWQLGEMVPDGFAVTLPEDAPSGDYPLVVGWYRYPSLERLPLASADTPLAEDRAVIATLTVTAP